MENRASRRDVLKGLAALAAGFAVGSWARTLSMGTTTVEVTRTEVVKTREIIQPVIREKVVEVAKPEIGHDAFKKRGLEYLDPKKIQETLRVLKPEDELPSKPQYFNINDLDWIAIMVESRYHEPGSDMVGSFTVIDMKEFRVIKRIKNAGDRVHIVRYGHEDWPEHKRRFVFGISRDCWVSKIDLYSLEITRQIKIGEDCRSVNMDKQGRYVIATSKHPGHAVIMDFDTLEVIKVIPFLGASKFFPWPMLGRTGAILTTDLGYWLVNVKDAEMVLAIDYRDPEFPIVHVFTSFDRNEKGRAVKVKIGEKTYDVTGIGKSPHELNKLDERGRYVAVTGQESSTITIIDVANFEVVNVVPTGKKPHPGPGTLVPGKYFLSNAIAEGRITVINLKTMDLEKFIDYPGEFPGKTGGGLYSTPPLPDGSVPKGMAFFDTSFNVHKGVFAVDVNTLEVATNGKGALHAYFAKNKPGKWAMHPTYTIDGKYIISALERTSYVYKVDAETGEIVKTIDLYKVDPNVELLEAPSPTGIFPAWRIKTPWL